MEAKRYFVPTALGDVSLVFEMKPREDVVVIIHGAGRIAFQLKDWLANDVVLAELPGHDAAPPITEELDVFSDALDQAIRYVWPDKPITLVGESLGSIVALQSRADRKILVDPPMELTPDVDQEMKVGFITEWLKPHLRKSYWHLLDQQSRPVDAICASRSILPPQAIQRLRIHPNIRFHLIDGGHVLMKDNPEGIARILYGD